MKTKRSLLKFIFSSSILAFAVLSFCLLFKVSHSQAADTTTYNCFVYETKNLSSTPSPYNLSQEECKKKAEEANTKCAGSNPNSAQQRQCEGKYTGFYSETPKTLAKFMTESANASSAVAKTQEGARAEAEKSTPSSDDGGIVGQGIKWLLRQILAGMGILLGWAGTLFTFMSKATNVTSLLTNSGVYEMWAFVRDILNVAFILVLLFSAFATIFQVSKYNYKNILLTLVIMALLVNFSYPITMVIIDASNVAMFSLMGNFFDADTNKVFVSIANNSNITQILNVGKNASIAYLIFAIIFLFILGVTLLAIGILLVIRTIALTILVIFSPIAFVGSIIPGASGKASQWWDQLFKYALFGPIMMLMLVVAAKSMAVMKGSLDFSTAAQANSPDASIVAAMSYFVIPIVILWMGMGVAQSMSVAGAGAVMGQAQKFMKGTAKFLGKKVDRGLAGTATSKHKAVRALQYFSPTALKTAWKQHQEEQDRKAFVPATGGWRDKLNKYWTLNRHKFGRTQSRYKDAAIQTNIAQKEKELSSVSGDFKYLYAQYEKANKAGDSEKVASILRIIANNNDLNDFMEREGKTVDPFEIREHLFSVLRNSGMTEADASKQLADLGEIAYSKGNFQLYGMARADKNGVYHKADNNQHLAAARGKAKNVKAQTKADLWHWNSFLQQTPKMENGKPVLDEDGNYQTEIGNLHEFGKAQLEQLNGANLKQMDRVRDDFIDALANKIDSIEGYAEVVARDAKKGGESQAKIIREFAQAIRDRKNKQKEKDSHQTNFPEDVTMA